MGDELPPWVKQLSISAMNTDPDKYTWVLPKPPADARPAAVLVALADSLHNVAEPQVLLIERASTLRQHAGQPAFPGGALDPGEDPVAAALREAVEEVGIDPLSVEVLARLPQLWVPPSNFAVTPVLAWWKHPHPVQPVDFGEVARVELVPVSELAEPTNRFLLRLPTGRGGPAFRVRDMTVWGFTAGLLDVLLQLGGWERKWQTSKPLVRHEQFPQ